MNPAFEPWDYPIVTASNEAQAAARPAGLHRHRHSRRRPLRDGSARPVAPADRPEAELLLCCARTQRGRGVCERIRSLAKEGIDWAHLVELARTNGVTPLLYRSLAATCADAVPEAVLGLLKQHYRANALRGLVMTAELLTLLKLFEEHGIQAIPFKGPVLAATAYGDVALREFSDLDVLIPKRDRQRARELLVAQGYETLEQAMGVQEGSPCEKHWYFARSDRRVAVELHWRFTSPYFHFPIASDVLRDRLDQVSLLGSTVPSLCPEDMLLVLCAHGASDCWSRLLLVCDLAQWISARPQLDWEGVLERASGMGSERRLLLGLILARDLLGATLLPEVTARMAGDGEAIRLAAEARRRILGAQHTNVGHVERCGSHLRVMERLRDKMLYGLGLFHLSLAPNMTDRSTVPLPGVMSPLYYLIRPARLAATYGPGALRYLFRHAP